MRLRPSALVLAAVVPLLGACGTTETIRHVSPAVSTPGRAGYGVTEYRSTSFGADIKLRAAGAAAMSPPESGAIQRDVVWRMDKTKTRLELCRPTADGGHACQFVVLPVGMGPGPLVDPRNLGRVRAVVQAGDYTAVSGHVELGGSTGIRVTPYYGVWMLGGGLAHCGLRNNQPVCVRAELPLAVFEPISVHVIQTKAGPRDAVWLRGTMGGQGFVRCEAGADDPPLCVKATLTP